MSQASIPSPSVVPVALGGLFSLAAAMGIGRFVFTPILPFMVHDAGLSPAQGGLIASANFLAYLIGALAAASGRLTELLPGNRRTIFLTALAISAATTAAMGLFDSVAAFIVIRFVSGLASAYVLVFASALVLDRISAAGRPGLVALHFSGVGLGISGSALMVAGLAASGANWRMLWYASGLVAALALLACTLLIEKAEEPAHTRTRTGEPADRRLLALYVSYGLFGFGYVITTTFISTMARMSASLSPYETAIWTAVGIAAMPSVALWGALARRIGNARTYAIACLVEALGVALSVISDSGAVVVLAAMMVGGTFIAITAIGLMQARLLSRGNPHSVLALMTASFGLGQMVGPTLAGFAYDATGSFLLPSLAAAVALVIAAALALTPERG
ncbi:putative MFS family arabinose efflux permease [Breoghania corrubedonensis]|uniref:Putative MFS family arabinose efflux permease n=1 Tax=Breoghania corrubedonensis TaxID=665038 RepID=A0A2T5UWA8_9HYPH|nr:YbfB/YjiJ family MFS transporter [Breoghania corrubedonensis]PTW55793.1 putative MFS family arabinose efflux permease [Breoghania corrubedonensis]